MTDEFRELILRLRDAALQQVDAYERVLGLPRTAELRQKVRELEGELHKLRETVIE